MTLHHLRRRLDRLGGGPSIVETLESAMLAQEGRQAAWTAAGYPGAPPHMPIPPPSADASHQCRGTWRKMAEGHARVIYGKAPEASPFPSLSAAYALDDDALMAAINSHPLYAGWPEYDKAAN